MKAIIQIPPEEIRQVLADPSHRVSCRRFDYLDGLPGTPQMTYTNSTAVRTADGRLWFATDSGLVRIDPAHLTRNLIPPPVSIFSISGEKGRKATSGPIRFDAGTHIVEIDYAGLSLSIPERVQFRYKLEGMDTDWQNVGTRRQAYYNNLGPGSYRFRVIACNNDGVWNETGAFIDFSVLPAYYQTFWFRILCAVALLGVLWALYQLRLHQIHQRLALGFEARIDERTRIARELHDTLLQSLHGVMFQFQAARNMLPRRPDEAAKALDGAILETEQAIAESRDAIHDLRTEPANSSDLAELLKATGEELAEARRTDHHAPVFRLIVEGERRTLSPELQDEVYRIAHEILRNAFQHSHANRIEAEIRYDAQELRLRVRDDGIGVDPKVLEQGGRPGHWGLRGVHERAKEIGAEVDFWSEAGAGTEVQLTVPAAVAYHRSKNIDGRNRDGRESFPRGQRHE
jgi:signal transduction histidine kinase